MASTSSAIARFIRAVSPARRAGPGAALRPAFHRAIPLLILIAVGAAPRARADADGFPPDATLEAGARAFCDAFFARRFDDMAPMMDATMRRAFGPESAAPVLDSFTRTRGAFRSLGAARFETLGAWRAVFLLAEFERGPAELKVVFDSKGLVSGFFQQPARSASGRARLGRLSDAGEPDPSADGPADDSGWTPAPGDDPSRFTEEETEVVASFPDAPWLPATLTLPRAPAPSRPVAVLVHGSGPNDRDETIGPNKPFKDLARGLASRGIAVLRYEKRTRVPGAVRDPGRLTVEGETIEDARAAVATLSADARFGPVFVIGHSLGGMLAPRIAAGLPEDSRPAGIAILAGPARGFEEMVLDQMEYILGLDAPAGESGTSDDADADSAARLDDDDRRKIDAMRRAFARARETNRPQALLGGVARAYLEDLDAYDPIATARGLPDGLAILVAQGGRDYQVRADLDYPSWRTGLADRAGVEFRLYDDLDHLFREGEGMAVPDDYLRPGNVATKLLEDLADWIAGGSSAER